MIYNNFNAFLPFALVKPDFVINPFVFKRRATLESETSFFNPTLKTDFIILSSLLSLLTINNIIGITNIYSLGLSNKGAFI